MSFGLFGLHGFTGRGSSFDDVLARLPSPVTAICPDLLGHGPTPVTTPTDTLSTEVERLAKVAAEAASPTILVGYSLGARLGLAIIARHPDRFAAAVLIGARLGLATQADRRARISTDTARASRLHEHGLEAFVDHWQSLALFASQSRLEAGIRAAHRQRRMSNTAPGLAHSLDVLGLGRMRDDRSALETIQIPFILLVGGNDVAFCDHTDALSRVLPNASTRIVAGRGHDLLIEAPEAVASAIQEVAEYV